MTFIGCNKLTLELLKETKNLENYAKKYNIPYHIYASHIGKLTPDFTFENRIYTGSEITATSIEIIDDNYTLVEGTDFNGNGDGSDFHEKTYKKQNPTN